MTGYRSSVIGVGGSDLEPYRQVELTPDPQNVCLSCVNVRENPPFIPDYFGITLVNVRKNPPFIRITLGLLWDYFILIHFAL